MRSLSKSLVVASAACVLISAPPSSADVGGREKKLVALVNGVREQEGRPAVRIQARLSRKAERNSRQMASAGEASHSGSLPGGTGEIVGSGPTLRALVKAFAASPVHRDIMLDARYHKVGVGVARAHGLKWVTMIFT
jgi:uncharacterized protein YkwD